MLYINTSIILSKILAFDYGEKRIGLAITDELQIIASGLATVETKNIFSFVSNLLKKETIELFIVGEPKTLQNKPSESEILITDFVEKLSKKYPKIPIKRIDERFTSKIAQKSMLESGLKKNQRKNKALLDEISATLILQSYLYYK